jgi:hypothetical protein
VTRGRWCVVCVGVVGGLLFMCLVDGWDYAELQGGRWEDNDG